MLLKENTKLYLDAIKFYSDEQEIEDFIINVDKGNRNINIFEQLIQEKGAVGIIASTNLDNLVEEKKGYKPYIVSDNTNLEKYGTIDIISNLEEYTIKLDKNTKINKGSCVMIKGNFNNTYKTKLIDDIKEAKMKGESKWVRHIL